MAEMCFIDLFGAEVVVVAPWGFYVYVKSFEDF